MRRAFAVLCSCVLVAIGLFAAVPAKAGDYGYNDDGYYRHRYNRNVWYSSNCCYRKVVRHERDVRYVRTYEDRYRDGYYDRPYRSSYYDRPYRSGYYDRPYRSSSYYDRPYRSYYGERRYDYSYAPRYRSYEGGYASYAESCHRRRVPMEDYRGGWVWGVKTSCY